MAKKIYKIPYTIDNVRFRALVSLKIGNFGPKRQIPIYQAVGWMGIILAGAGIIYMTPIKYAMIWAIPFGVAFFGLGVIGLKTQKNGLPGYRWIKPTFEYLINKGDRYQDPEVQKNGGVKRVRNKKGKIGIRFTPELERIRSITDLDATNGESLVSFQNGDLGAVFRVAGFTSLVILDNELDQIIDAIDRWNANLDPDTSWTLITDRSNQRVKNQLSSIRETAKEWNAVGGAPAPIQHLLKARFDDLKAVHLRHKSSQQYLVLRAGSIDKLDKELQRLGTAAKQGMLKSIEQLEGLELELALRDILGVK